MLELNKRRFHFMFLSMMLFIEGHLLPMSSEQKKKKKNNVQNDDNHKWSATEGCHSHTLIF